MNSQTTTTAESDCPPKACGTARRNRFFAGKTMRAEEFLIEQEYGTGRRRLITRAIAGWGVVSGLGLEGRAIHPADPARPSAETLYALPGLAIDRHGREAALLEATAIGANNTFLVEDGAGGCRADSIEHLTSGEYLLSIHYAERRFGQAKLPEDCGCAKAEQNFACETAVFSLRRLSKGECPCGEPHCARKCHCGGHGCAPDGGRGPHACLCQWSTATTIPDDPRSLCAWREYWIDPEDGVRLACVYIESVGDECHPAVGGRVIDDCTPRRLVKTNDLLYDLIRGCDLTRIRSISWAKWHRAPDPVDWAAFTAMLQPPTAGQSDHPTGFTVTFSGPVSTDTVTPDCFALKFTVTGEDTGWFETRIVAITRVLTEHHSGDPLGTTRTARLCVDAEWYEEVTSRGSKFKREGATVVIEVNGDFILDCHGQAVDANARGFALRDVGGGHRIEASGNGTPGGQFLSVFRILQRPASKP